MSGKVAPEVAVVVRHKQANDANANLRVRIETVGAPADELRRTLLTIESEGEIKTNRYALIGEINSDSLDAIAARDEVKSISLAPASGDAAKDETSDSRLARRLMAAKVAPELASLVRRGNTSTESVRVIVVANADAGVDLRDELSREGKTFQSPDLFAGRIAADKLARLAARDDIAFISPDHEMRTQGFSVNETTGRRDLLQRAPHITGANVGIAVLDTGVASNVVPNRLRHSVNFVTGETTTSDLNGHGSVVASLAAGADARGSGSVATGAHIINVRVLNRAGIGLMSDAIKGLEWVIKNKDVYKIRVVNMSIGARTNSSFLNDPLCRAAERAVAAGLVVVASAGNLGKTDDGREVYGGITSPAIDPLVIAVGAVRTWETSRRSDDVVADYSSRGPTRGYRISSSNRRVYDNVIKPDLVAPGSKLLGVKPGNNTYLTSAYPHVQTESGMIRLSGTSMSAPVVAGTTALMLQENPALTPTLTRAILQWTAQPIANASVYAQGAGLLNIEAAVTLADRTTPRLMDATVGDRLLTASLPSALTRIAGEWCARSRVVFFNGNHIFGGDELMRRVQKPYQTSLVWFDNRLYAPGTGTVAANVSGTLLTSGVRLLNDVVTENNWTLDGDLNRGGSLLPNGILTSEGVLTTEGVLTSEGILTTEAMTLLGSQSCDRAATRALLYDDDY